MAIEKNVDAKVAKIQTNIKEARTKLNTVKSGTERQLLLDQIADYNRQIEALTKQERKIVPVMNAPIYMNRATNVRHGGAGRSRVPLGVL